MEDAGYLRIDSEQARTAREALPDGPTMIALAELYKLFGDGTRLGILTLLCHEELCVYDIARILSMTDSAVSHQLRILRQGRLIRSRREGKTVVYSLADEHVRSLIRTGLEHVSEEPRQNGKGRY